MQAEHISLPTTFETVQQACEFGSWAGLNRLCAGPAGECPALPSYEGLPMGS